MKQLMIEKKILEFRSTTAFKQSEANRRKKFKSSMKAKPVSHNLVFKFRINVSRKK